jgi:hypothetical protein
MIEIETERGEEVEVNEARKKRIILSKYKRKKKVQTIIIINICYFFQIYR